MNETTLTTLSTLKDALSNATVSSSTIVNDKTILGIRNALVDMASDSEESWRIIDISDLGMGQDSLEYMASVLLTCAVSNADEVMKTVNAYCGIDFDQRKIDPKRCASWAIADHEYKNRLILNQAAAKGFDVDDWGNSCDGHVALGTVVEFNDEKYIVTAHYKEEDAASENYPDYADYYVIKKA